ncbi:N1R/p28-like protein [Choristoneura biennis entomopoxvirus]|uniref:N1R/p28-like protein n=1 Tax=Choristoneura biennis entomopoxvirus TaxID=10288 RepID=A0A916KPA6_CBEPV|nr:N1R/p28-like protein [Choristoneura biennis entomopoxvirus]YP_008004387.1 N1R/p28-like protein [Choristoneura biennis entomopoxvirus]CCU55586.1 N1R/p28-like protein [Choristoneura biennis entomopoxvirus]CCU55885.1 N1R/p28-like protein [Choristoneura biennis entomopoxvirus]
MSLIDICYEQIKDSFHYGLFGEFRLIIDKNTGYFNATKLCKDGGKLFYNWSSTIKSKELIEFIDKTPPQDSMRGYYNDNINIKYKNNVIYEVIFKNNDSVNEIISGSYVSKDLILAISIWISNEFYLKCNKIIEKYYIDEYTKEYKNNKHKLQNKIKEIEKVVEDKNNVILLLENTTKELDKSNKELDKSNKNLNESINKLTNTIENVKPKIITPSNEIKENDYNYYITTVCERDYDTRINYLINIYPNLSIVLKLIKVPNSKYLLDTIKNNTVDDVDYNKNKFNLKEINIDEYINIVMEIKESIE